MECEAVFTAGIGHLGVKTIRATGESLIGVGKGLPEIKRRVVAKWAGRGKLKPTVCSNIKTHVTLP